MYLLPDLPRYAYAQNTNFYKMLTSGIAIAERRREKIAKELKEYQACLDNIQNKLDMTSELEEGIVEELTEQDIKRSTVSLFTATVQICSKI